VAGKISDRFLLLDSPPRGGGLSEVRKQGSGVFRDCPVMSGM